LPISASEWFAGTRTVEDVILLVRHALVDACGRFLAGRMPGVHLNTEGRRQAAALRQRLASVDLASIYTSPLERARETAAALAGGRTPVLVDHDLLEVDFGMWTGMTFDDLNCRDDWRAFNRSRSTSAIPGGEWMVDVQSRACNALQRINDAHPHEHVALVSHGDVLRALVARLIEAPLDRIDQFVIDPASISVLEPTWRGFELIRLNCHAYCDDRCTSDS
jgi:broad specificity phosphatase PhoE